ncbi:NHL domain protein [Senna tora]|uniref:NHL domain protein n=1 Tax=Senna tora TaxID=362788 RepID=A0A835CF33_9FABA|nr:NHL domain protein [Senna tora]
MSHVQPDSAGDDTSNNALLANTRCCFCFPCFGSRPSPAVGIAWWQRVSSSSTSPSWSHSHPHPTALSDDRWWSRGIRALKKLREWSEIVAGPRWKTFIRRFNRNRSGGAAKHAKYQYDPLSYSLNFDEGPGGQNGDLEDHGYDGYRNFSTRYAAAPPGLAPIKSASASDVGPGKDVAVFA